MFSSALVCLLAELCKNYSTDFHKIWQKGGTWATEKPLDQVTLFLGLHLGGAKPYSAWEDIYLALVY